MTTIVFKKGVMAGDSQITDGNHNFSQVQKVFKLDGYLLGVAGTFSECQGYKSWIETSMDMKVFPEETEVDGCALLYDTNKELLYLLEKNEKIILGDEFVAIGSGAQFAIGALEQGASAKKAVQVASKYDVYTGGDIKVVR